jgi:hypothetical protein
MGLKASTVMQWSARGKWLADVGKPKQLPPASMQAQAVSNVSTPAEALGELLAEDERETRVSLSRSARRMAAQAEAADLSAAAHVHQAAKVAALVHRWDAQNGAPTVSVSVLLGLGSARSG